jgi:hypothetical protein
MLVELVEPVVEVFLVQGLLGIYHDLALLQRQ